MTDINKVRIFMRLTMRSSAVGSSQSWKGQSICACISSPLLNAVAKPDKQPLIMDIVYNKVTLSLDLVII